MSEYKNILNEDSMMRILNSEKKDVCELFDSATKGQQKNIAEMAIEKIGKGEYIDSALLYHIKEVTGIDVQERGSEYFSLLKEQKDKKNK